VHKVEREKLKGCDSQMYYVTMLILLSAVGWWVSGKFIKK